MRGQEFLTISPKHTTYFTSRLEHKTTSTGEEEETTTSELSHLVCENIADHSVWSVTSAHLYGNVYMRVGVARELANSSDFRLLGEQSSQKWEISCLGRR